MPRYFIEVAYKGTNYSGFQIQQNANSIQSEVNRALKTFFRKDFELTGSSRTDAGVHALQNYFHFDISKQLSFENDFQYNLNSLLPGDIVIKNIFPVKDNAHCRFDAVSREYKYFVYQKKDPFLQDIGYYFPYKLDVEKLNMAAQQILKYEEFNSFSKKNTQVKHFLCKVDKSEWVIEESKIVYIVIANRFLRGMVKGLVGTMLKVGTNKISLNDFLNIIENKNPAKADFSAAPRGLFLIAVNFNPDIFYSPVSPIFNLHK